MRVQRKLKTFYIDNHGCSKNQVDSEEIHARLSSSLWRCVDSMEDADLIIVNTCGFIEDAKKESLGAVIAARAAFPDKKILLAGCLAERYGTELAEGLSEADAFFGNGDLSKINEAAEAAFAPRRAVIRPPRCAYATPERTAFFNFPRMAYIKITEGCNNRCSFCAIPNIRGALSSRGIEDICAEMLTLLNRGLYELCLIGQDLGSYGADRNGRSELPALLSALCRAADAHSETHAYRLRLLYMHPDHFPRDILPILKDNPHIAPYFDIPFQHASTPILRAMKRSGDYGAYIKLLDDIRRALPLAVTRSTFLLGFPGESDADYALLRRFQDEASLDWLGAFTYSREEGTEAYALKGRIPKKIAAARLTEIVERQALITERNLARFVGTEQTVLVEEMIDDFALARGFMNAPEVDGSIVVSGAECKAGDTINVRVSAVRGFDLEAEPCP